ncbi:hypothetical protein ACFQU3_11380 [Terrabacter sp. GCM10028922]|uniref:hypothetical protein n=1 Tax=Terrabacter sp. GCM10028922 TaxID=3273428 RepID=UPI0036109F0E
MTNDAADEIDAPAQAAPAVDEMDEIDEALPGRSIRQFEPRPRPAAQKKLAAALSDLGFSEAAAYAIVRAVESPEQLLSQLKAPAEFGVHGGTIRYVTTRVLNGTALPIPTNPRVSARVRYPAGVAAGGGGMEPLLVEADPGNRVGLLIKARSPESLKNDMREAAEYIANHNDLRPSVQSQGVLLPLTVVPVAFTFDEDPDERSILATIDGSSRLTAAMGIWHMSPQEVLFQLTDDSRLQARRSEVSKLLEKDERALTATELAQLRTQSLPANLIVGWEGEEAGLTFPHLVDAYLGLIHVEPPTPWGDAAGGDKRADSVLDELERLGRIDTTRKRYLAGLLSPEDAAAAGFDGSLDGRAAEIFFDLCRRANANAVNRALRRIGMHQPTPFNRLEVATELAVRPYRYGANENVRRNPRQALPTAMQRFRPVERWSATRAEIEELRDAALEEAEVGAFGNACAELAVRGAFWLTRYSALQRSSRTDTRFADELLEDVATQVHGIHLLYQAVVDGRSGTHPRQVREDGSVVSTVSGSQPAITDQWLRESFPRTAEEERVGGGEDTEWTPRDVLRHRIYGVRADAESLANKLASLREITETGESDGQVVVDVDGIPKDIADEMSDNLDKARTRVLVLRDVWMRRSDGLELN